jgi:hypothetical protein
MSDAYQVDLQPLRQDKFLCKNWPWIDFYKLPTSVLPYSHYAEPKDTPLKVLAII